MSGMNFLERLLDGAAVEWKPLGEVATVTIGEFVHKNNQDQSAKYPVYNGGTSHTGFYDKYNNTGNKIIVSARGANAGFVNKISEPYWAGNSCYSIGIKKAEELNWSFVYYFLKLSESKLISEQQKGSIPAVSKKQMETFQIPIPCPDNPDRSLAIQAEIVRILDTFTALTAELTAELSDRQKQYEYYRDRLLTFEEGEVEWKALGDLTLPTRNIRWKETDRPYRYIDLTSVSRENNLIIETSEITALNAPSRAQKLVEKDDVIFATTRPTQLRLCLINEEYSGEVASTGYCVLRANADEILPKWIYYHLSSLKFFKYVEETQSGSAYPAISDSKIKEFKLPIPYPSDPVKSLAEQARIVAILDKFDTLTHSISEGLPREIALRQQQYEYYRDLLLSFPKSKDEEQ